MANLRRILASQGIQASEETLERAARQTFQHFGKHMVDFLRFSRLSRAKIRRMVSIERAEYMNQAAEVGKGVLVVTAHLGSWEIGAATLMSMGQPLSAVVLPERNQKINKLFQRRRRNRGIKVIPLGRAAAGILRALRRKEWVAVLADRDYSKHNDFASFFGAPARMPTGPARLCVKTGAPVLPGFLLRQDDDTFLLRWHPPIVPEADTPVSVVCDRIRRAMENAIAEHPSQWFMFEDFWNHNWRDSRGARQEEDGPSTEE